MGKGEQRRQKWGGHAQNQVTDNSSCLEAKLKIQPLKQMEQRSKKLKTGLLVPDSQ